MFGYVVANLDKLSPEETGRYRACYCGLCKALSVRHGALSRFVVNYDMTFMVLFLSSLYREESRSGSERCMTHPFKSHAYWINPLTEYAADMTIVLAYFNFLDDWRDEKKILSLAEAKLLKTEYKKCGISRPRQCSRIGLSLEKLSEIEKSGELNPDIPANCFGELMGEIFSFREDKYAAGLREFGASLGKFIYIMDACLDLKRDIKKECYNPMIATPSESFRDVLDLLMADCAEKYKRLPISKDKGLIENILYSGVWTRYEAETNRKGNRKRETEGKG